MIETLPTIIAQPISKETGWWILGDWRLYFGLATTGLFTGLGSAIGNYFANKHLIEGVQKITDRIKGNKNGR